MLDLENVSLYGSDYFSQIYKLGKSKRAYKTNAITYRPLLRTLMVHHILEITDPLAVYLWVQRSESKAPSMRKVGSPLIHEVNIIASL